MPPVISKPKEYIMKAKAKSTGRVFCVTGVQSTSRERVFPSTERVFPSTERVPVSPILHTASISSSARANTTVPSDSESNTSGYLSSSSFESSGEERRLVLNESKVFRVWDRLSDRVRDPHGPKSSTPKQESESVVLKHRFNSGSSDSSKGTLVIKKTIGCEDARARVPAQHSDNNDSFWGIQTPRVHKSSSEGDVRAVRPDKGDNQWKRKSIQITQSHDAGLDMNIRRNESVSSNQSWKRKPFLTQSTSQPELRGHSSTRASNSNYSATPTYRVQVRDETQGTGSNLVTQICKSCADFADQGKPVDESMSEFLAKVDTNNLASFLNFYDRVTHGSAYERARKNTQNYEAVYY